MRWFNAQVKPIESGIEAVAAWRQVYADRDPAAELDRLCTRLAVTMVTNPEICDHVAREAVGKRPAVSGYARHLAELACRVRIMPLAAIAESDVEAAAFLVRHPQAIRLLLEEQGPTMARAEEQALAPQAREWPQEFLRSCMNVAPVVLEQAGIGREHGEQFLQYLQQPEVLAQIQNAPGVRERLGPVLAHFYRAVDFQREEKIEAGSNQAAVDRLLWQVAVALVRQSQYGAGRAILEEVHRAVSNPAIDKPAIADWTRAEHSALGESTRQPGQEEGAVRAEHRLAQMYRILTS